MPASDLNVALHLMRQRNPAGAVAPLRRLLAEAPTHALAHALLAQCLALQGDLWGAEDSAGQALALAPGMALAHRVSANLALMQLQFARAEQHLDAVLAQDPQDVSALRDLSLLYARTERAPEAERVLRQACALEPDNADILAALGEMVENRRGSEALDLAEAALRIDPAHDEARVLRGRLHLHAREYAPAAELAMAVLSRDAGDRAAMDLLIETRTARTPVIGWAWRFATARATRTAFAANGFINRYSFGLAGVVIAASILLAWSGVPGLAAAGHALPWIVGILLLAVMLTPQFFRQSLRRELRKVRLRDDF